MRKIFASLLVLTALTACGGGSGSSAPVTTSFAVSILNKPTVISESTGSQVVISFLNIRYAPSATLTTDSPYLQIFKQSDTVFVLTALEVENEETASVTLTAQDGSDRSSFVSQTFSVDIQNTSFDAELANIVYLKSLDARLIDLAEELSLMSELDKVLGLFGVSGYPSVELDNNSRLLLSQSIESLSVSDYQEGFISDKELLAQRDLVMNRFDAYVMGIKQALNDRFLELAKHVGGTVFVDEFYVNSEKGVSSFFTGNPDFGAFEDQWVFNSEYAHLDGLLKASCGL